MFCDEMGKRSAEERRRGETWGHSDVMEFRHSGYRRCCTWLGCFVMCNGYIYLVGMVLCVISIDVLWFLPRE